MAFEFVGMNRRCCEVPTRPAPQPGGAERANELNGPETQSTIGSMMVT